MQKWFSSLKIAFLTLTLLLATSCGNTPKLPEIPGVKGPLFNLLDGKVLITVKLLKANLGIGAKVPIPKTKDSFFEVSPNLEDSGTLVVFHLDVDDLKNMDIGVGDGNTLPDGRPIPGIPGGTLETSLRINTEILDMSFYFHKNLFGFYVPLGWNTNGLGGSYDVIINDKNIGMLGLVPSDTQGRGAGFILFLRLQQLNNKQFKRLLNLSKRNPHTLY